MPKLTNYAGSVVLASGIVQDPGMDYAMVEAHAVQTGEDGTRLDDELSAIKDRIDSVDDKVTNVATIDEADITEIFNNLGLS